MRKLIFKLFMLIIMIGLLVYSVWTQLGMSYIDYKESTLFFIDSMVELVESMNDENESSEITAIEIEDDVDNSIEIFIGNDGYYYELLTSSEKQLYGEIVNAYLDNETIVDLSKNYSDFATETIYMVHKYVLLDYPEIFWISSRSSVAYIEEEGNKKLVSLNSTSNYTDEEIVSYQEELKEEIVNVEGLVADCLSDYEVAIAIYEYIVFNCDYDMESANIIINEEEYSLKTTESITIIGCLINDSAVCSGYAKAYTYLMRELGVEAFSVIGHADGVAHEWNMVYIDDSYYHLDCTWGDPTSDVVDEAYITYGYFGLTTEVISNTHVISEDITYPLCNATEYNYYVYNGLCYDTYSYTEITELFDSCINNNDTEITFTFSSQEVYEEAISKLMDEDLSKILSKHSDKLEDQCSYSKIEDIYCIIVRLVYN